MPPNFNHHNSSVTSGRCVHPIERIHYDGNSRVESECCSSGLEIVVDRFGNADAIDPGFLQLLSRYHRAIAPDDDQRLNLKFVQDLFGPCNDI
jgi:hypothetical protein